MGWNIVVLQDRALSHLRYAATQVFTGASELDLMTNELLKSRRTTPAAESPTAAVIPALAGDLSATQTLDLVLHSDQHLRPTANELVEFVVKVFLKKSPLHLAATGMHEGTVRNLLHAAKSTDNCDETPASAGSALYDCVNALDSQGDTPLHALLKVMEWLDYSMMVPWRLRCASSRLSLQSPTHLSRTVVGKQ